MRIISIKAVSGLQVIYIDVLVLLNCIISLFLILISSALLRCSPSAGRTAAGTVLGGAYSLLIFAPDMGIAVSLIIKLLLCVSVVSVVYKPRSLRYTAKCLGVFFLVNFAFAGLMLALKLLISPGAMEFRNGTVYFDLGFFPLAGSVIVCYALILVFNAISAKNHPETLYEVTIESGDRRVECSGLLDSGNTLTDPFTGEGIMITDKTTAVRLANDEAAQFIESVHNGETGVYTNDVSGVRLLPYSCVSGGGIIPVFRVDKITLTGSGSVTVIENAEIAAAPRGFENAVGALINPYMMKDAVRIKK